MKIKLYKTLTCPKCQVLTEKLDKKGIDYEVCTDVEVMRDLGIQVVPVLVIDGIQYDFIHANKWINEVEI